MRSSITSGSRQAWTALLWAPLTALLLVPAVHAQLLSSDYSAIDFNGNGVIDVLLIGNSQFGFVPDPPMAARALVELANAEGVRMSVDLAQVGGVGCEGYWTYRNSAHWMEPQPRAASGNYDIVILQPGLEESVYTTHSGDFSCWDNFRNLVQARGIQFGLFGTLHIQSSFVAGTDNMDQVNKQYADSRNLLYVPAGRIIRNLLGSAPSTAVLNEFYESDHEHPNSEAMYIYVLALFRALSQVPVTGITYVPPSLGIGQTRDASGALTALSADEAFSYQQAVDSVFGTGSGAAGSGGVAGHSALAGAGGAGSGGFGAAGAGGTGGGGGIAGNAGVAGAGGSGGTALALGNDLPVAGLSGYAGQQTAFTFTVPAEATSVSITLTAGSGNADLYVRRGVAPTLNTWDCRPYLSSGENETCSFTNSGAATYYVMLYARRAYSGAGLRATYKVPAPSDGVTELVNGSSVRGISGSQGSMQYWKMSNVPARRTLTISVSGFSGNVDLYVRQGSEPTLSSYSCRPYLGSGRTETCDLGVRTQGTFYILLHARTAYSNATLRGSY